MMALVKCPDCGREISNAAPACPNCGRPSALKSPLLQKKKTSSLAIVLSAVVGVLVLLLIVSSMINSSRLQEGQRGNRISEDTEARLYVQDLSSIMVAVDETAFDELIHAAAVKDHYGIVNLILSDRVFVVENNTRVQVIDSTLTKEKVRILEGNKIARAGWVPSEWVK